MKDLERKMSATHPSDPQMPEAIPPAVEDRLISRHLLPPHEARALYADIRRALAGQLGGERNRDR
jgi:hypothetical protein